MKNNLLQKNIPQGWKEDRIGTFGLCIRGVSYAPKDLRQAIDDSSIELLRSNNIKGDKLNLSDVQIVSREKVSSDQILKKGDIFICMSNGSKSLVGKNVFIDNNSEYTIGAFCALFHPDSKKIEPPFVKQLFLSSSYLKQIQDSLAGTSINNLKNSHINDLKFLFPPKTEQQKIAEILGMVDADITKTQEVIETTEKLKRGLMQQLFTRGIGHTKFKETDIGKLPMGWKVVSLGKYVDIRSGDTPSGFNFEDNATIPFYKVEEMNHSTKYLISSRYFFNSYSKPLMPKGMIVFPKRGAAIYMNKVRILASDSYFDTNVMGLITKNDLQSEYLYYLLIHIGLSQFADTTSVAQINNKHIEPLLIPFPENNEQKQIAEILSAVDEKISVNKKLKEKLTILKKGLMQDLLSGKVRTK